MSFVAYQQNGDKAFLWRQANRLPVAYFGDRRLLKKALK